VFLLCVLGVVVLAIFGAGMFSSVNPLYRGRDSARPPCEQLPDQQAVADALATHQDLARRIQEVGPGVTVEVATPCEDQPERAILRITYATDDEWEGVDAILREESFGVAVEVVGD
jgi:hypothetical protein